MKKIVVLFIAMGIVMLTHSQTRFLKKMKDKVDKGIDKTVDKATGTDNTQTEVEKKEDVASSEYNDATENGEKPLFATTPPANGKLMLTIKAGDNFWGGYVQLTSQPGKEEKNPNILDHIKVGAASLLNKGEMSAYASYLDGERTAAKGDDGVEIPMKPTQAFLTTTITTGGFELYNDPLKECTYKYNGKTYGPYVSDAATGKIVTHEQVVLIKQTSRFYAFLSISNGWSKTPTSTFKIITENNPIEFTYYSQGKSGNTTLPVTFKLNNGKILGPVQNDLYHKYYTPFLSDNGFLIALSPGRESDEEKQRFDLNNKLYYFMDPEFMQQMFTNNKFTSKAIVDFNTVLTYEVPLSRQGFLTSSKPEKSVFYKDHFLYYANGSKPKEQINNMGNVQLLSFNGKEYLVWFEVINDSRGPKIYVAQKEL
jgi:hypothetical protein